MTTAEVWNFSSSCLLRPTGKLGEEEGGGHNSSHPPPSTPRSKGPLFIKASSFLSESRNTSPSSSSSSSMGTLPPPLLVVVAVAPLPKTSPVNQACQFRFSSPLTPPPLTSPSLLHMFHLIRTFLFFIFVRRPLDFFLFALASATRGKKSLGHALEIKIVWQRRLHS